MTDSTLTPEVLAHCRSLCNDGGIFCFLPDEFLPFIAAAEERDELRDIAEAQADPESVGNPAWLARQMEERAHRAEAERDGWHRVVTGCERVLSLQGTAESPLRSDLENQVRDVKVERDALRAENDYLKKAIHAASELGPGDELTKQCAKIERDELKLALANAGEVISERDQLLRESAQHCACLLGDGFPVMVEWQSQCGYHAEIEAERDALRAHVAELEANVSDMTNRMAANVEELTYGEVVSLRVDNVDLKDKVADLEEQLADAKSQLHTCPTCGESCIDCQCVGERVAGLESEVARLKDIDQNMLLCPGCNCYVHSLPHEDGELSFCQGCYDSGELARLRTMLAGAKAVCQEDFSIHRVRNRWHFLTRHNRVPRGVNYDDLDTALFAIGQEVGGEAAG